MSKSSRAHRIRKLQRIAARDGGWWIQFEPCTGHAVKYARCYLCGKPCPLEKMTVDHKIPRWKFRRANLPGANGPCNLSVSHSWCNQNKAKSEQSLLVERKNRVGFRMIFKRLRKAFRRFRYKIFASIFGWPQKKCAPVSAPSLPQMSLQQRELESPQ